MIVDGTDQVSSVNFRNRTSFIEERHRQGAEMFENMGASAPAFGMIGTIGLS